MEPCVQEGISFSNIKGLHVLGTQEPVVCAEDKPAVSAEEEHLEFAEEKPAVSAEDKLVA